MNEEQILRDEIRILKAAKVIVLVVGLFGIFLCAITFGYSRNWIESTPVDTTVANLIDDYNRYLRVDAAERLEDYIAGFNSGDSNAGFYHILFIENAASLSTPAADKGLLYGKLIDSKCELVWLDEDGDEKQITSGGVLKIASGDFDANAIDEDDIELSNDSWLKAKNNAGDGDANLIKLNTSDVPVVATDAELQTAIDANDNDNAITDKKYVDDQIVAKTQSSQAEGTSNITTTSATFADMTDMSITITTTGGDVLLMFSAAIRASAGGSVPMIEFYDGSSSYHAITKNNYADQQSPFSIQYLLTSVSAAEHTFKVRWKVANGTGYQDGATYPRVFTAVELP